jgi:predicted GTPase
MGYGNKQVRDLEATIEKTDCDTVIIATPADIRRIIKFAKPVVRVGYELKEQTHPNIEEMLTKYNIIR